MWPVEVLCPVRLCATEGRRSSSIMKNGSEQIFKCPERVRLFLKSLRAYIGGMACRTPYPPNFLPPHPFALFPNPLLHLWTANTMNQCVPERWERWKSSACAVETGQTGDLMAVTGVRNSRGQQGNKCPQT